jgi:hypothetical protein
VVVVYISSRGDVVYSCDKCQTQMLVPVDFKNHVFWDVYNGMTILQMLEHYRKTHPNTGQFRAVREGE